MLDRRQDCKNARRPLFLPGKNQCLTTMSKLTVKIRIPFSLPPGEIETGFRLQFKILSLTSPYSPFESESDLFVSTTLNYCFRCNTHPLIGNPTILLRQPLVAPNASIVYRSYAIA